MRVEEPLSGREAGEQPPLGGMALVGLGVGYSFAGAATHVVASARLATALNLSLAGRAHALFHAFAPPAALVTALACFLDMPPQLMVDLGKELPRSGLWRPRFG